CELFLRAFFGYFCYPCKFCVHNLSTSVCVACVALAGATLCYRLPSAGITLLHQYYAVIRLLTRRLAPLLYYHLSAILHLEERVSSPKLTCHNGI
ncbi:hypothetical protein, partial [Sporotomaculum syntrophicum]|uniref:hypothetical protein n=1 Tax=Sporotomaculum syntrophicum TaxID=182264 RepID=UPI001A9BED16